MCRSSRGRSVRGIEPNDRIRHRSPARVCHAVQIRGGRSCSGGQCARGCDAPLERVSWASVSCNGGKARATSPPREELRFVRPRTDIGPKISRSSQRRYASTLSDPLWRTPSRRRFVLIPRSTIHVGISTVRRFRSCSRPHRHRDCPRLTRTSYTATARPNHGCHG